MSDFDYWPRAALSILVKALEDHEAPPLPSDTKYWHALLDACRAVDDDGEITVSPTELANDVRNEFQNVRFIHPANISTNVAVGDLGCAESRLAVVQRGTKGIIYLASHDMESLWEADGVKYHTVVVSPAIEPSKTLSSQLMSACSFIKSHRPALICSSCPRLPALVLAAYHHHESGGALPIQQSLTTVLDGLAVSSGEVSSAERAELDAFAALLEPPNDARRTRPMPPPATAAPVEHDTDSDGHQVTDLSMSQLTTPKRTCKKDNVESLKVLSSDSTLTQIDAEIADASTPTAKSAGMITRRGMWKRSSRGEVDERELDDDTSLLTTRKHRRGEQPELVRGDCTTCTQENVLGWPRPVMLAGRARFECCACHDANDDDDLEQ